MDILSNLNLCKLFFASITLPTIVLGALMNIFEPYLPVFIGQTVRYGKFASKQESSLLKKLEVPKSSFRHFYITAALIYYPLVFYEVISVYVFNREVRDWFVTLLNFSCGHDRIATVSATRVFIAVVLMVLQVSRRFYDTHFVSVFSKRATINLTHYLIGMVYYPAVALIILSEAPKFARNYTGKNAIQFSDVGLIEVISIVVFLWAWYHQHVVTVILANLRKNKKGDVVNQNYKIPEGDWFKYLSSPHSTAEIIMYTALTLLLFNSVSWWYVYAWILSNQVETILLSHWWYQSHFKNFPKNRKALVPFLY
jgi:3-oxo-5-alpha-steroid 4-dehydrogenase 3